MRSALSVLAEAAAGAVIGFLFGLDARLPEYLMAVLGAVLLPVIVWLGGGIR